MRQPYVFVLDPSLVSSLLPPLQCRARLKHIYHVGLYANRDRRFRGMKYRKSTALRSVSPGDHPESSLLLEDLFPIAKQLPHVLRLCHPVISVQIPPQLATLTSPAVMSTAPAPLLVPKLMVKPPDREVFGTLTALITMLQPKGLTRLTSLSGWLQFSSPVRSRTA